MKRSVMKIAILVLVILAACCSLCFSAGEAQVRPMLSNDDCVKCHDGPPADIASAGMKHKLITCQDCHAGHPPKVKKPIPVCSQCHQGNKHFELKGCLTCHKNPHTPLNILFPDNTTEPCLTCHDKQIVQLRENRSKHTSLSCTTCHGSVHRKKPECLKCHKPHASDMAASDCGKCHKAHMPKVIAYDDVPSKLCAACHKKAFDLLNASSAKHKTFNCSFCHQARHKMIPKCQSCHGAKHPAGIMAKFPNCYDCHKVAHDLNNWPVAPKKEQVKKIRR
ncbi:MAG: cytochrome C [Nitrospirae bacterium]|nr:cytochrome C [Nitrospirota bacterium]